MSINFFNTIKSTAIKGNVSNVVDFIEKSNCTTLGIEKVKKVANGLIKIFFNSELSYFEVGKAKNKNEKCYKFIDLADDPNYTIPLNILFESQILSPDEIDDTNAKKINDNIKNKGKIEKAIILSINKNMNEVNHDNRKELMLSKEQSLKIAKLHASIWFPEYKTTHFVGLWYTHEKKISEYLFAI